MKKYVYPKLSKYDIGCVRLGGGGLGNLLFIFARSIVLAEKINSQIIWPTWPSIKVGPRIRREKDKRFYGDLFKNDGTYIAGAKKMKYLLFNHKVKVDITDNKPLPSIPQNGIYVYSAFKMHFDELISYREIIRSKLLTITRKKNLLAFYHDFTHEINVHVRLGDFAKAEPSQFNTERVNTRLPINWYVQVINDIKSIVGDEKVTFNIFSDGTDEELKPILSIAGTRRIFFGNALADIFALSESKLIIASASSFSLWARYLGNSSCITFSNQLYENICTNPDGFEFCYGFDEKMPDEIKEKIRLMYV